MTARPCSEMHLLLQAELDGELDVTGAAILAGHLADCERCRALQANLADLSTQVRHNARRLSAPPFLRAAVLAQSQPKHPVLPVRQAWRYGAAFGAGMGLAACLAAFIIVPGANDGPEVVAAHIRALQPGHLSDVASTDRHTVKPWFNGRLDYAPPVTDLATRGFPLIGGRLDYVAGRPVAALIYRRDKHLIDVFVWPSNRPGSAGTVQGYHVIAWTQGGMTYRAVSDLAAPDLARFAAMLQAG